MTIRGAILTAVLTVALAAVATAAVLREGTTETKDPGLERGSADAARRFLERYMEPDGRVVRHDQGGDTVSEGQAYAMLAAVAADDERRFRTAWRWTKENLQRPDGALGWLWKDGALQDPNPAADADLDAARALIVAARRFKDRRLAREADRIGRATLRTSTIRRRGRRILVAGPWARRRGVVNPSYIAPRSFDLIGGRRNSRAWQQVAEEGTAVVRQVTSAAPFLAPDWAKLTRDGRLVATSPPGREDEPPSFSFDAQRVAIRMAESCSTADRRSAARMWPFLRRAAERGGPAPRYGLRGRPAGKGAHPLGLVAAAAAADAAGDAVQRDRMLDRAEELDGRFPTYYGAAWVALGRAMLQTDQLGGCPKERG